MTNVEYDRLRPRELAARREACPVAYIGFGTLEWHGYHNPVGLDGIKAHHVACYLAEKIGGVAMPPQYYADQRTDLAELVFDPATTPWLPEGSIDHTAHIAAGYGLPKKVFEEDAKRSIDEGGWALWGRLTQQICFQLQTLGFRMIVALPGHYPIKGPLQQALEAYQERGGTCYTYVLDDSQFADDGSSGDHAAYFETSMLLATEPDLVDLEQLPLHRVEGQNVGALGEDPSLANAAFGREVLAKFEKLTRQQMEQAGILR